MGGLIHELKIDEKYFASVKAGLKKTKFSRNDRSFNVWDVLILTEYKTKRKIITTGTEKLSFENLFKSEARFDYRKVPTGQQIAVVVTDVTIVNNVYPDEFEGIEEFVMISFEMAQMDDLCRCGEVILTVEGRQREPETADKKFKYV